MATPPIIAVGFLCQRSVFGFATNPQRRANARTSGVSISASANETAGGIRLDKLRGNIFCKLRGKSYSISSSKASRKKLTATRLRLPGRVGLGYPGITNKGQLFNREG